MGYYGTYYSYGLPLFLITIITLYLLFTGQSTPPPKPPPTLINTHPHRLGRGIQRRPLPRRIKSFRVGSDGHRVVHGAQRIGCWLVRP